jgi:Ser/Thr protein kinase RdoA (MazF antagonist)
MFLSGSREHQTRQLDELLAGYSEFCDFNGAELGWIEALRTMRMMHYAAWLGRRWSDPAFPHSFPWFNDNRYWSDHILELREQLAVFDQPPLQLY